MLPAGMVLKNLEKAKKPLAVYGVEKLDYGKKGSGIAQDFAMHIDDSLTWEFMEFLRQITKLPVLVKVPMLLCSDSLFGAWDPLTDRPCSVRGPSDIRCLACVLWWLQGRQFSCHMHCGPRHLRLKVSLGTDAYIRLLRFLAGGVMPA
jgi:hypothetical protein